MSTPSRAQNRLQNALLGLYRRSRQSRLMQSALGRRLFEQAYLSYKLLLEAGPVGQLQRFVPPGSIAVDVGANIGFFTLRFARWVGAGGRVIAIEPEAENFAALQRRLATARLSDRVVAIQAIAAEAAGTAQLEINKDHPGDHKIGKGGVPVAAVTLDAALDPHGDKPVSLVKIDVQGAEMSVLRGAAKLLERHRPALFVEIDDKALRKQGSSAGEVFDALAARGYRPYRLRRFAAPELMAVPTAPRDGYEDILFLNTAAPSTAP